MISASTIKRAQEQGRNAGLLGLPSSPHHLMYNESLRRAYEGAYDTGRQDRLALEKQSMQSRLIETNIKDSKPMEKAGMTAAHPSTQEAQNDG